ncbi:hypothetical protein BDF14DRAFT_1873594 [Spinellus fusiger]|nr:hypothetical protein BDF14DRAFT_1873594 [Spinellus fusiger]
MFKALHRFATDQPIVFWSFAIGSVGPLMVWTVPSIRRNYFGFKGVEPLPVTYPLPRGARNPPAGYED